MARSTQVDPRTVHVAAASTTNASIGCDEYLVWHRLRPVQA